MSQSIQDEKEYILGTDPDELNRLGIQHKVWSAEAFELWNRMNITQGSQVLDVGCGPGFASLDLAQIVGPKGSITGVEISETFVQDAKTRSRALSFDNTTFINGDLNEIDIASNQFDAAYCRWVLCWLDDPQVAIQKVADSLKQGGVFGIHEYVNWSTARFYPERAEAQTLIDACIEGWRLMDGNINIAAELSDRLEAVGLEVTHLKLRPKLCRPSELTWQWPITFLEIYSLKLIEMGLLTHQQRDTYLEIRPQLEKEGAYFVGPLVMEIIGTKK